MPASVSTSPEAWLGAGFLIFVSLAFYGAQVRDIVREGGRVKAGEFDLPELLMTFVFAGLFTMLTVSALLRHGHDEAPANVDTVLPSAVMFIIIVAGIAGFMRFRGLRLRNVFGLFRVPPLTVAVWACLSILAAFPLTFAANAITALGSHGQMEPQPLVELFHKSAAQRDYSALIKILVSAVGIAPVCEEFLFRGFFYGVWKRYLGPWSAGFLACLLFAAFHTSLAAFGGLFVLAACLNIAYERTGSLLVPMCMHAIFNFTSLLVIYGQAHLSGGT